ncbi:MAG TPA: HlyU family transcriptional regulator [Paracoccaceae bacterium]|nr:HlyU family transcriptional regulator [Paracoccaceae bacterium]
MSLFSKLFGASKAEETAKPEEYKGFLIYPEPMKEGSVFRVCARVEKEIGGEMKSHRMIRADTAGSAEEATKATLLKAKMMIDQQGESIFN